MSHDVVQTFPRSWDHREPCAVLGRLVQFITHSHRGLTMRQRTGVRVTVSEDEIPRRFPRFARRPKVLAAPEPGQAHLYICAFHSALTCQCRAKHSLIPTYFLYGASSAFAHRHPSQQGQNARYRSRSAATGGTTLGQCGRSTARLMARTKPLPTWAQQIPRPFHGLVDGLVAIR